MSLHSLRGVALLAAWAVLASACAGSVRDAARSAAPSAVSGSLEGLHEPQNRERIAELLRDPAIREASGELARAISSGALTGLTDLERDKQMQLATDAFIDHFGSALARSLRMQIGPEISTIVARSVNESMAALFSAENQERAREFANGLVPAPPPANGVADKTDPRTESPAGQLARNLAREAALGVQDAVHQSVQKEDTGNKQKGDILAVAGKSADQGGSLLRALAIGVGALALALVALLVWAVSRARYRRAGEANEQAALLFARALKDAEGTSWAPALTRYLEQAANGKQAMLHLQRLLQKQADARSDGGTGAPIHVGE